MIVALLADAHGNLPALQAVLEDARRQGAGEIWNLGDFVGYGPFPDETVNLLKTVAAANLSGNYDVKTLKSVHWPESKRKDPLKRLAFQWAYWQLSEENRQYLETLPEQILMFREGARFLLVHGSPASISEPLGPVTSPVRLEELAGSVPASIVLCGHSHQAFDRQAGGVRFINPGAVGRPDDGDPRAAYALLQVEPQGVQVLHHRVEYDVRRTAAEVHRRNLPEEFASMFLEGRSLDDVLGS